MDRKNQIMKKAIGMDYSQFQLTDLAFDYENMMSYGGYTIEKIREIQKEQGVGNTPLYELKNITKLVRKLAPKGKGARIFLKDEASNPSGSFKARRAAISVYHAKQNGYKGVIAATSGNYGAAVASQAAMQGIESIIVQEAFDSKGVYQPEIMEKGRACEAYGSEVLQLSVGPELFYVFLRTLEETGYFNASLYTPFGIAGIETLGLELAEQVYERTGQKPHRVVVTHAGGGNLTGTARGLIKAGCKETQIIGASIDLQGLHMASDHDFNKKSFTTGHTGFGVPFATWPDRADVPKNAARPLRYMDRYVTITQGEAFYVTEMLAVLEGLERGPAGNTSLAAAIPLAMEMDEDQIIVVQETEYTGAGKHLNAQLAFAKENGINVYVGNPKESIPGKSIVLPEHPSQLSVTEFPMDKLKRTYLKNVQSQFDIEKFNDTDWEFLAQELNTCEEKIKELLIGRER
ncbi:PLP-dependent lyase/thiolase [Alkalicella caledoniensis]|uniref:PLP-dependent lyase/thiolase n=2 Tax=Alkalicella caledoniensis TaxID=2731377 RepID=A0A7G9WD83_ALKCA|nr:PLP-dependent lyase/thiolase [Alkalicella caledoniensis]